MEGGDHCSEDTCLGRSFKLYQAHQDSGIFESNLLGGDA